MDSSTYNFMNTIFPHEFVEMLDKFLTDQYRREHRLTVGLSTPEDCRQWEIGLKTFVIFYALYLDNIAEEIEQGSYTLEDYQEETDNNLKDSVTMVLQCRFGRKDNLLTDSHFTIQLNSEQ